MNMYVDMNAITIRNGNGNDLYTGDNADGITYRFGSSGCTLGPVPVVVVGLKSVVEVESIGVSDDTNEVDNVRLLLGTIRFCVGTFIIIIRSWLSFLTLGLLDGGVNRIGGKETGKFNAVFVGIIILGEWIITIFTHHTQIVKHCAN